jgi:hypothetical protein
MNNISPEEKPTILIVTNNINKINILTDVIDGFEETNYTIKIIYTVKALQNELERIL